VSRRPSELPAAMSRAFLRCDVRVGGVVACSVGLTAGVWVFPVMLNAPNWGYYGPFLGTEPIEPVLSPEVWLASCAMGSVGVWIACAVWLWRPLAAIARRLRMAMADPTQRLSADVEVLMALPRRLRGRISISLLFLVIALIVDGVLAAIVIAFEQVKPVFLVFFLFPWFLVLFTHLCGLLTLCAVAAMVADGFRFTFRNYCFIGGQGQVSMRRLWGRRARVRDVHIPENDPGFGVSTGKAIQPLEVVGVSWEADLEYAAWLREEVTREPVADYRAPPHAHELLNEKNAESNDDGN